MSDRSKHSRVSFHPGANINELGGKRGEPNIDVLDREITTT